MPDLPSSCLSRPRYLLGNFPHGVAVLRLEDLPVRKTSGVVAERTAVGSRTHFDPLTGYKFDLDQRRVAQLELRQSRCVPRREDSWRHQARCNRAGHNTASPLDQVACSSIGMGQAQLDRPADCHLA